MAGVAGLPDIIYANGCDTETGPKYPVGTPATPDDCRTFSLEQITSRLTRLRNASGFNTPAWHVYTKLMEQLENYPRDWIDYLEPAIRYLTNPRRQLEST